jgi:hypothetical protein
MKVLRHFVSYKVEVIDPQTIEDERFWLASLGADNWVLSGVRQSKVTDVIFYYFHKQMVETTEET